MIVQHFDSQFHTQDKQFIGEMNAKWLCCLLAPIIAIVVANVVLFVIPLVVDSEIFATSCELAGLYGFHCVEHLVTTKDGYILTVHRINKLNQSQKSKTNQKKKVALLMHCLECDSSVFLTNTAEKSLGFVLADSDIDVWLGNSRGTFYSSNHTTLSVDDPEFWDFTWQEMAWYDLPAIVDYILSESGAKGIYYIGQSQGTLIGFAQMSRDVTLQSKIKRSYMLSPFVTLQNIQSPVKYVLTFVHAYGQFLNNRIFLPLSHRTLSKMAALFCPKDKFGFCLFVYHQFSGFSSPENLQPNRISVYFAHSLSGTSLKNVMHYAQLHLNKKAAYFDHVNKSTNVKIYGSEVPAVIDVSKVRIPVALFAGQNDWLVSPTDVQYLIERLPNVFHFTNCSDFSHLDFIWGTNAIHCAYKSIREDILRT